MRFTDEEKAVIWKVLKKSPGKFGAVFDYGVYVLPTILFSGYGLWKSDFAAMVVAYLALLIVVVLYLSHSHKTSESLRTALQKYENKVNALKEPSDIY
jgi:hypothetical protein